MTIDEKLLTDLVGEGWNDNFAGEFQYQRAKRESTPSVILPTYKVWNPNAFAKPDKDGKLPEPTPGIVMTIKEGPKETRTVRTEITQVIKAVILYQSPARKLGTGQGANFRVLCESCDGATPAVRIDAPLCRDTTEEDVAKVFSQWKNYDQAKVDARVVEVTQGSGKLQFCGLKSADGFITLCPYGRSSKHPKTGKTTPPDCKQYVFVHGYDVERNREFRMELTGQSISTGKFFAPFHSFFKFLRENGPQVNGQTKGLPCYAFEVTLTPAPSGQFYYLNVDNYQPVSDPELRAEYKQRAEKAYESYQRSAARLSDAAFKASREKLQAAQPEAKPFVQPPSPAVSFEDDDIPF